MSKVWGALHPSDRIYLNSWINESAPDLIEGLHYSIMFYGGRLLSHLSANDPDVDEFISLRRLNRYIAIVIDSDRSEPRKRINQTKKRVRDEFNEGPGFAWITKGREIENYIDPGVLEESVKIVHPSATKLVSKKPYDNSLHFRTKSGKIRKDADKVGIAREVSGRSPNLDVLDLKEQMGKLIAFIREANVLPND